MSDTARNVHNMLASVRFSMAIVNRRMDAIRKGEALRYSNNSFDRINARLDSIKVSLALKGR